MQEYLKYNYYRYMHLDEHRFLVLSGIFLIALISICMYSMQKQTTKVYETTAQMECQEECLLEFYYPSNQAFVYDYIRINEKKFEIEAVFFGDAMLDSSNNAIQNIKLKVKEYQGNPQEFVQLQIYQNKEKFLTKIFKIIKER